MKTFNLGRILFVVALLCLHYTTLLAHETLVGTVQVQGTNAPVWGATVQIKGTTLGTITNEEGRYTLICDSMPDSLSISFLGFKTQSFVPSSGERNMIFLERSSLSLEEINVEGLNTRGKTTLSNLDLALKPVNSSQEILRTVPGLFIGQHAGGGKAEQIFLRGYDIDHGTDINIKVDGMPVNMVSHAHGQGYADLHFLIPELIEKVDFDKGPHFADQGNFATAGYVQFNSIQRLDQNRVQVEAGSFNRYRILGMVNLLPTNFASDKNQSAFIATEFISADGPFESPQDFQRFNIFYKHSFTLNDKNFLKVQASHFRSSWNASGQIPESAVEDGVISRFGAIDPDEGGNTDRTNLSLQLNTYLSSKQIIKSQVFYSKYNFTLFSNFTFFLEDSLNGDRIKQQEFRNIFGGNTSYEYTSTKKGVRYVSTLGTGLRYDMVDDNELSHVLGRDSILEQYAYGNVDETNYNLFAKQSFSKNKWTFTLGARLDFFNFRYLDKLDNNNQLAKNALIFSPKISTIFNANKNLQLYLNTGTGFHSNDTRAAVYAQNRQDILPRVYGADLGTNAKIGKNILLNAAAWTMYQENELVYVGDAGIVEANGRSLRFGLDLSARVELLDWLFLESNFNYTHARSVEGEQGENYIPLAPSFTSTGGVFVKHKSGINGSLSYRHISDRPGNEDYSLTAIGYTLMDMAISYRQKKYELGFVIQNLLNSEWREAQFETESRISAEAEATNEIHFTPGSPINFKAKLAFFF